jgi:hypothetical protein
LLYTDGVPFPDELLELLDCEDRELLVRLLAEDLLDDELLLEGSKLEFELDDSRLDEDLLDTGAVDELVATDPHEPKSLHAFVHAQPTPGSHSAEKCAISIFNDLACRVTLAILVLAKIAAFIGIAGS